MSGELEGAGTGSGTSQGYSGSVQSECIHPISRARAGQSVLHTDKVHNARTVSCSNPTETQSKATWCAHLLVIELYALPCVPTKEPSSL